MQSALQDDFKPMDFRGASIPKGDQDGFPPAGKPSSENPREIREDDFPWYDAPADKLKFLLSYAVLAPSVYNTQPWLFRVAGPEAELYADRSRMLIAADTQGRHLTLSCGAALFNLRMGIRQFGYDPVVRTFPDLDVPDLLAYVRLGRPKETTLEEHRLFMAIKKRFTNRGRFAGEPLVAAVANP